MDSAARYIANEVNILRYGKVYPRDELVSYIQQNIEDIDFSDIAVDDLVVASSIFVDASDRFPDIVSAQYVLTVKTNTDLSNLIPFWKREYISTSISDLSLSLQFNLSA